MLPTAAHAKLRTTTTYLEQHVISAPVRLSLTELHANLVPLAVQHVPALPVTVVLVMPQTITTYREPLVNSALMALIPSDLHANPATPVV